MNTLASELERNAIRNILKNEGFTEDNITVTKGSKDGDNFMGVLLRIKAEGRTNGSDDSINLIYKTAPVGDQEARAVTYMTELFAKESYVYNHVLPEFEKVMDDEMIPEKDRVHWPKAYMTIDTEDHEGIIMEDVGVKGYKMAEIESETGFKTLDWKHLKVAVEHLAKLHGLSYVLKSRYPAAFKKISENCREIFFTEFPDEKKMLFKDNGFFHIACERALKSIQNPKLAQKICDFRKSILKTLHELGNAEIDPETAVFCHGDTWTNNYLFKYDKDLSPVDLCLVDFQIVRTASPLTDIMYMIATSTDKEFRKKHYDDIFDHYHASLGKFLNLYSIEVDDIYSKSQFLADRKKYALFGLFWSFMALFITTSGVGTDNPVAFSDMSKGERDEDLSSDLYGRMINDLANDFDTVTFKQVSFNFKNIFPNS